MSEKRKISIIGSTGSIGTQALEVIEKLRDKFEIIALAGGNNTELLKSQAEKFRPKYIYSLKPISVDVPVPRQLRRSETAGSFTGFKSHKPK